MPAVNQAIPARVVRTEYNVLPFRTYGVEAHFNTMGVGGSVATPLADHFNLRLGTQFFSYSGSFNDDAYTYVPDFKLHSGQIMVDYFPFHNGFHISPGLSIYRNGGSAAISIAAGKNFDLGDGTYTSSPTDPVRGTATIDYSRQVAPMVTLGWGNLVPRKGARWSIPVEIGGVFTGSPTFGLVMMGSACDSGRNCAPIQSDPSTQANVVKQRQKVQNSLNDYASVYPIVSIGFGWSFGPK